MTLASIIGESLGGGGGGGGGGGNVLVRFFILTWKPGIGHIF